MQQQQRPRFLNLLKIRLPVTGITSILHRISGALLFLTIPALIYVFHLSLESEADFNLIGQWLALPLIKAIATVLAWSLWHHLLAGIRYLFNDVALGLELEIARRTAWIVNVLSVGGLLGLMGVLWR